MDKPVRELTAFAARLNPVLQPDTEFDPADPRVIGQLIAKAMMGRDPVPLSSLCDQSFYGSGVYANHYDGPFDAYRPITGFHHPIYVGKADPGDVYAARARQQGQRLWHRLARDHPRSLGRIRNLDISHFHCRHLDFRRTWQTTDDDRRRLPHPMVQTHLEQPDEYLFRIRQARRQGLHPRSNTVSPWDTLHPGRPFSAGEGSQPNPKSSDDIKAEIAARFAANLPITRVPSGKSLTPTIIA